MLNSWGINVRCRILVLVPLMTGAGHAAAYPPEGASHIAHLAVRILGTREPMMGQLGRLEAYSWVACEDFAALNGLVAVACGCWEALLASQLGWSRQLRSRCPGWARVHSGKPTSALVSIAQSSGMSCNSVHAYLDQVLALGLGDQRLKFGRCESVDQAGLRHDQQ